MLSGVKLIAEPWDFGAPDSYAVGRFPVGWVEYNDTYRDWSGTSGEARGNAALSPPEWPVRATSTGQPAADPTRR